MDNVLFKPTIVKEDRTVCSKYVLLNARRITDFYENQDEYTEFHYAMLGGLPRNKIEYVTSWGLFTFESVFDETQENNFITLNVTRYNPHPIGYGGPGTLKTWPFSEGKINIVLEHFVKAEAKPSSETGSYVWVARNDFNYVVYEVDDTLDEINSTSSASGSLPA
jgi:hypothetical protein